MGRNPGIITHYKLIPKVKELNVEYTELLTRKKAAYGEYHEVKKSMKKLSLAKKNVETFLDLKSGSEVKATAQSRNKRIDDISLI